MGKRKNIYRKVSKRFDLKREEPKFERNPFEIHQNRVKHNVIGRKSKTDRGLPGVSRDKALKRRKETLLQEYKKRFKSNKFVDRRLGEYKSDMSVEDKMTARFTFERQRRKNIFNLNEDDELTHHGHSLAEIEKFEDPRSDEDEDEDKTVDQFMKDASFGGFLKPKKSKSEDEQPKSRKDWIEELIAISKQKKHERQTDKDDTSELTEKLDSEWKDVRTMLASKKKPEPPPAKNKDPYDLLVHKLQFESKAKATDRLKTAEEMALEEKEKLERLENERIKRMNEMTDETSASGPQISHRSADDLDDCFYIEEKQGKKVRFLEYVDGELVPSEDDSDETLLKEFGDGEVADEAESVEEDNDGGGGDGEESEEDGFSDLDSDEGDEDNENNLVGNYEDDDDQLANASPVKTQPESKDPKPLLSPTKKEVPFVLQAPEKYEDFLQLVDGYSEDDVVTTVERLLKYYHASLAEGNKQKLELLFAILLQHINDAVLQSAPQLSLVDKLMPHFFNLALVSPGNAMQCMKDVLVEKYAEFDRGCHLYLSGMRATFPDLDTLIFFKLVSVLFPTSDFRHAVVTPGMLFMGQILSQCRVKCPRDVVKGIFVCNIFLEYVTFSKRYVPEAITFLRGILSLAVGGKVNKISLVPYSFRIQGCTFLQLEDNARDKKPRPLKLQMMADDFEPTDEFRVAVVWTACELLVKFARLCSQLSSFREIFSPVGELCDQLNLERYPSEIEETVNNLKGMLAKECVLVPLKPKKRGPLSLPLLNPRIEENFRPDRKHKQGKAKASEKEKLTYERQKLVYKIKKETKGAIREIRRDNQFLAKQQLDERIEGDIERKRKVKIICQQIAEENGVLNAMQKEKKRRKLK